MNESITENVRRFSSAFRAVMHTFHSLSMTASKTAHFSLAQYRVLMLVYHRKSMTLNELKNALSVAQSSASEMVKRLVQLRHLRKEKDLADGRITRFHLTARTEKLIEKQMSGMTEVYQKVLEPLTSAEKDQLVQAFETIQALLQKVQLPRSDGK